MAYAVAVTSRPIPRTGSDWTPAGVGAAFLGERLDAVTAVWFLGILAGFALQKRDEIRAAVSRRTRRQPR